MDSLKRATIFQGLTIAPVVKRFRLRLISNFWCLKDDLAVVVIRYRWRDGLFFWCCFCCPVVYGLTLRRILRYQFYATDR